LAPFLRHRENPGDDRSAGFESQLHHGQQTA
jgi:hypothetical protein